MRGCKNCSLELFTAKWNVPNLDNKLDVPKRFIYVPAMSKPVKNGGASDLPFEEALKQLEVIVESMEAEDVPLELLLSRFEEGTRLAKVCQTKLAEAEVKIQELEKNAGGEMVLKPSQLSEEL